MEIVAGMFGVGLLWYLSDFSSKGLGLGLPVGIAAGVLFTIFIMPLSAGAALGAGIVITACVAY